MKKISLNFNDAQVDILRSAIERYYYICKGDSELRTQLDLIDEVETIILETLEKYESN